MLLCLFIILMVTVWLTDMLATQTVHMAAVRNTVEYEQALYLANAGVHHAAALLEATPSWRGTATDGSYPASGSYQAVAVDGAVAGTVDITSAGVAGSVTRHLAATVQIN
jgi:type II secretory pathway component PulK